LLKERNNPNRKSIELNNIMSTSDKILNLELIIQNHNNALRSSARQNKAWEQSKDIDIVKAFLMDKL